ncbi:MAG: hypothetical protein Q9174_005519, partial [Haloplaca sp. 1 TL-2023]
NLEHARAGEPVKARFDCTNKEFFILLFHNVRLRIPSLVCESWELTHGSTVNLTFDIREDGHPDAFAAQASETSDARKLGIQISKDMDGG